MAVWRRRGLDTTFGDDRTEMVESLDASSRFLPMLGIPLAHGRTFTALEDTRPTDNVIVTYETWQRRFGGRADIIGQTATIGSASSGGRKVVTIVGVVSRGFSFGGRPIPELLFPGRHRLGNGTHVSERLVADRRAPRSRRFARSRGGRSGHDRSGGRNA